MVARSSLFLAGIVLALIVTITRAEDLKSEGVSQTVIAEGIGKDSTEARQNAARQAIATVVGSLLSAETIVNNDKIISDQILEHHQGFIERQDVIKEETTASGLVRVRLRAVVRKTAIDDKLVESKVHVMDFRGADEAARKSSREQARAAATGILAKVFADLPKLLEAHVVLPANGKPSFDEDDKSVGLDVVISVNTKKYAEFLERSTPVLERLAIAKGTALLDSMPYDFEYSSAGRNMKVTTPYVGNDVIARTLCLPKMGNDSPKGWNIWMLTNTDGLAARTRWQMFFVDSDVKKSLEALEGVPTAWIRLLDASGKIITEDEFPIGDNTVASVAPEPPLWQRGCVALYGLYDKSYTTDNGEKMSKTLLIAPLAMLMNGGGDLRHTYDFYYAPRVPVRRRIKLTDQELARVTKIETSVVLRPAPPQ